VNVGDAAGKLQASTAILEAEYDTPFAAHATMEPMNCTARVTVDACDIWAPTQGQELAFFALKGALQMRDDQIRINRTPNIGGGFGRRLIPDFVVQAALISKAVSHPVKAIWDREEDIRRDFFRPATRHAFRATLDAQGMPAALAARVVAPTILLPVFPTIREVLEKQRIDPSSLEGYLEMPYDLADRRVDFHLAEIPVPTSVMRTTGYGPNLFAFECFLDELASAAKMDPFEYRRRLLRQNPRGLKVLDRAQELAGEALPLGAGRGRGLAFAHAFGTLIAQVIDVRVDANRVHLERIVSVVDCGRVLDPGIARAGIEGGSVFGLAYCKCAVTFRNGSVVEDNFDQYQMPTLAETPELVVEFVPSDGPLGGIGEVSPVTTPPALCNALFAATGRRLRSLPLARHGLVLA
jgi:isoquinoline 1-oxidoreductase beta subunit